MATHEKLSRWLKRKSRTRSAFADKLGVSRSVVTRWCKGDRVPNRNAAVAIELHTAGAIKAADWGYALSGTPGQRAIQQFLLDEGLSIHAAAKRIGVATMSLRQWANGAFAPRRSCLDRLRKSLRLDLSRKDFN